MTDKTSFELSIDTKTLIERLDKAKVGETVTYSELSDLIGRDVLNGYRYILQSAVHHILQDGKVFGCVRKVGVKRLSDAEIVGVGEQALPAIRRRSKRAMRHLAQVQDFAALPKDKQQRHNALVSALGVIAHFTKPKQVQQIEAAVSAAAGKELPVGKTLQLFGKAS